MNKRIPIHPRLRQRIFERDNFKCVNCGCSGDFNALEADHIISVKDGGTNDINNLQTLCYKCNMDKYYKKNITNKYLLDLKPLERLELIKERLNEYKSLTYDEFKVIFTQDELFKRLRINLFYIEDLFRCISGNKKNPPSFNQRYTKQRDEIIFILRQETGKTYRELEKLLKNYNLSMSFAQINRICAKFGEISTEEDKKDIKEAEKRKKEEENEEESTNNTEIPIKID